jgi:hypothetical protein
MARSSSFSISLGVVLLAVGGILLIGRFVAVATAPAWMLGLGLALAVVAIVRRLYGVLVIGMVLLGTGAGMVLGDHAVAGWRMSAWVLAGSAAGLVGLWVIALLLRLNPHPWPLVAAGVLVAVLAARLVRELNVLPPSVVIAVRTWWPAALVLAGSLLLVRGLRR